MKITNLFAAAALVGLFATPAKAVTVNYDITFDFTNSGVTDVVGHLAINSPPATFPGTFSGPSGLAGLIASFTVTFQNPVDAFSCTGSGCIFNTAGFGGFTGLTFNSAGALTAIGANINIGGANANAENSLLIGDANFANTGTSFLWNPPEKGNGNVQAGITITQMAASPVPGPVVGAGLPGLVMALGGLVMLSRRRRNQTAVA
jgi:hypothetical protein